MTYLYSLIILFFSMTTLPIFDFNKDANIKDWVIVDDVVMGGRSSGSFNLDAEGHGVFSGAVSLENNGGFSSVRHSFDKIDTKPYEKIVIRLKGDGKKYQFRVKASSGDFYSYISYFTTTGDWQEVEVSLEEMYPSFRGRKLNQPNFSAETIEEIAFLIGNKRRESFKLLLDWIELR